MWQGVGHFEMKRNQMEKDILFNSFVNHCQVPIT